MTSMVLKKRTCQLHHIGTFVMEHTMSLTTLGVLKVTVIELSLIAPLSWVVSVTPCLLPPNHITAGRLTSNLGRVKFRVKSQVREVESCVMS